MTRELPWPHGSDLSSFYEAVAITYNQAPMRMSVTTLLLAGAPVHVVDNWPGHADPSTTLRVYAHVLREQAAGAADVFAQAVEAAVSNAVSK
ncbi:MAG TPA: hypothetical protein VFA45_25285 [Actinomycetes bacterium]|nr:hypothetical protein [Actinomycetes bacterium]